MKKSLLSLCFVCVFALMSSLLVAQVEQGSLTLEITEVSSDNQQAAAQLEMMKGTQVNVFFKGKESVTKMNMMGGMVETNVKMNANGDMDMLMSMMGQKMWIQATKAELDRSKIENENAMTDLDIVYDESDTKNIAGFDCYKMVVTSPDNEGFTMEAYITEELKINAAMVQNVDIMEFKGLPLEYIISNDVPQLGATMKMVFTTTNFSKELDLAVLELNTDGYTKMSWEDFMSQMGGGFGF